MLIKMNLARIVIVDSEDEKMSMIVLREIEGERAFPILIGVNEAYAIDRRLKGVTVQRPLTHDLVERMIEQLDCQMERIVISELRDSTFYAKLVLRRDGELVEIDSRPSDAIAIGAGTPTPIFVDDSILKDVC
jgi:bifunctional DNase/RNase